MQGQGYYSTIYYSILSITVDYFKRVIIDYFTVRMLGKTEFTVEDTFKA